MSFLTLSNDGEPHMALRERAQDDILNYCPIWHPIPTMCSGGSGHLTESRKTRWATQAPTREPVFTRRFEIFTEQPRREFARWKKKRLFSSSRPSTQLSWTVPTGSITSHTPLINQVSRPYLIPSHVVARARRCDGRRVVLYGGRNHIYVPWRPRASESRAPSVRH